MSRLLSLLIVSQLGVSALAAGEQLTRVAAGDLQLTLLSSSSGVRIDRLLDTQSGQELLATNPLPLFSLTLRQTGSTNQLSLGADSGWSQCRIQPRGARLELRWSRPLEKALAGLSVTATVSPETHASALRWKLRVDNTSTNWSVWRVVFPQVALANLGTNAVVLFPRGPGELQRGVWDRPFSFRADYPNGWCSMQFMAAYREGDKPAGLYVATHDPWGSTKDLVVESNPAARTVRLELRPSGAQYGPARKRLRPRRRGRLAGPARRLVRCGDDLQGLGAARSKVVAAPGARRPRRHAALDARVECVGDDRRRAGRVRAGGEAVPRVPRRAGRFSLV